MDVAACDGHFRPLNESLDRLDAVSAGRRILATLGPRKLAGAVPLLVTPDYTAWAREILGEESTLVIYQLTVGDTDAHRADRVSGCAGKGLR